MTGETIKKVEDSLHTLRFSIIIFFVLFINSIFLQKDHYMWNYLFYIAYLNDKDETEYTGIESYIASKINKYDCSWFPINRSVFFVF